MKSIADLQDIRDKAKHQIELRRDHSGYRMVVGMATCGIAAGARDVVNALLEKIYLEDLSHVIVTQSGCLGFCRLEPVVELFTPNGEKFTYVNINPDKALEILEQHVKNGNPVSKYIIGNNEDNK